MLRRWITVLGAVMCSCLPEEQAGLGPFSSSESTEDPTTAGPDTPTEATDPETTAPDVPDLTSTGGTSSGTTDDTTAADTGDVPVCGNGVIESGEACDDGDALNLETAACLPNCTLATCGDGHVQAGVEQCDLGIEANSYNYGGCIPGTCFWGPACGDGEITPGKEVCDPGAPVDPMDGELTPCNSGCRYEGRVVFLSSETYTGKEIGGLVGADAKCRQLARTFDLERFHTYKAWLSDGASDPAANFVHADVPYVLLSGVAIADSFDDLTLTGPTVGITITDKRTAIDDAYVWTHTTIAGTRIMNDNHCMQWDYGGFEQVGTVGRNSVPLALQETWSDEGWWTHNVEVVCNKTWHLYCFEN